MAIYSRADQHGPRRRGRDGHRPELPLQRLLFAGAGFCLWRAVAIPRERLAWLVIGLAIVSWTAADIVWTAFYANDPNAPYPSIADALWLIWYPATLVALVLLVRSRMRSARTSLWLDGLIGAVGDDLDRRGPGLWPRHPRRQRGRPQPGGADRPRLSGRRPAPPRHDRRDLRAVGLAARAAPGSCWASVSLSTPPPTASTSFRPPRAPGRTTRGSARSGPRPRCSWGWLPGSRSGSRAHPRIRACGS